MTDNEATRILETLEDRGHYIPTHQLEEVRSKRGQAVFLEALKGTKRWSDAGQLDPGALTTASAIFDILADGSDLRQVRIFEVTGVTETLYGHEGPISGVAIHMREHEDARTASALQCPDPDWQRLLNLAYAAGQLVRPGRIRRADLDEVLKGKLVILETHSGCGYSLFSFLDSPNPEGWTLSRAAGRHRQWEVHHPKSKGYKEAYRAALEGKDDPYTEHRSKLAAIGVEGDDDDDITLVDMPGAVLEIDKGDGELMAVRFGEYSTVYDGRYWFLYKNGAGQLDSRPQDDLKDAIEDLVKRHREGA